VTHVLRVSALEIGHPMMLVVLMESDDASLGEFTFVHPAVLPRQTFVVPPDGARKMALRRKPRRNRCRHQYRACHDGDCIASARVTVMVAVKKPERVRADAEQAEYHRLLVSPRVSPQIARRGVRADQQRFQADKPFRNMALSARDAALLASPIQIPGVVYERTQTLTIDLDPKAVLR